MVGISAYFYNEMKFYFLIGAPVIGGEFWILIAMVIVIVYFNLVNKDKKPK